VSTRWWEDEEGKRTKSNGLDRDVQLCEKGKKGKDDQLFPHFVIEMSDKNLTVIVSHHPAHIDELDWVRHWIEVP
jgi:hypothetical protein